MKTPITVIPPTMPPAIAPLLKELPLPELVVGVEAELVELEVELVVEPVEPVEPVETVETVEMAEPVEAMETVETMETIEVEVVNGTSTWFEMMPIVEAVAIVNQVMMLMPALLQHDGA